MGAELRIPGLVSDVFHIAFLRESVGDHLSAKTASSSLFTGFLPPGNFHKT